VEAPLWNPILQNGAFDSRHAKGASVLSGVDRSAFLTRLLGGPFARWVLRAAFLCGIGGVFKARRVVSSGLCTASPGGITLVMWLHRTKPPFNSARVYPHGLPPNEQENAGYIDRNLSLLYHIVDTFGAAVALYDYCENLMIHAGPMAELPLHADHNILLSQWELMAARMGAISIYEFHEVCQSIDALTASCPSIEPFIDKASIKSANKLFHSHFKNFATIRAQAAHGTEFISHPRKDKTKIPEQPMFVGVVGGNFDSNMSLSGVLDRAQRAYTNTVNGTILSYTLDSTTENVLIKILTLRVNAFKDVQTETLRLAKMTIPREKFPKA
jgi:hypothetical protein